LTIQAGWSVYKSVRIFRPFLSLALLLVLLSVGHTDEKALPDRYDTAIGTCYEELKYPYPTAYLNLYAEGQDVRMCFMDVPPTKNANGRSVVLLHGKNFWGAYWADTIKFLTDRGYRVIVPDQIGFGKSSKPDVHYSLDFLAQNTAGLLDLLQIPKASIVGHSMGGMTAAVVASQLATAIRGVILADPTFLSPQRQREVHGSDVVEQHRRLLSLDKQDVLAQARVRHAHRRPEVVELVTEARLKTRIGAFDVLTPPNPEYHQLVSTTYVPILLVIGDNGVVSLETAQELQKLNPRLRVERTRDHVTIRRRLAVPPRCRGG